MNIQDPEIRNKVRAALGEISASITRIEAEKDLIKEVVKKLSDETSIPKSVLNKSAKVYHKQNYKQQVEEYENFQQLYETLFN